MRVAAHRPSRSKPRIVTQSSASTSLGPVTRDHLIIDVRNDQLGIERPGSSRRVLAHLGQLTFFPSGAPAVRIAFARAGGKATQLTVADTGVFVTATRAS